MSEKSSPHRSARSSSITFPGTFIQLDPAPVSRRAYSEDSTNLLDSPPVIVKSSGRAAVLSPSSSAHFSSSCTASPSISSVTSSIPLTKQTAPEHSLVKEDPIVLRPEAFHTTQHPSSSAPRVERSTRPSSSMSTSTTHLPPASPLLFGDYLFPENPAILDLLQVYQLDKSSKQKDFRQSLQLHAHLMGLALAARTSRGLDLAYDHAHDAFKNKQRPDRRNEFVSSFNYAHEETERILHFALAQPHPRPSFLDMLSQSSSSAILSFLHLLRTNHTILAKAFQNLQSQELDMLLLPERASVHPVAQSGTRGARDRGYSMQFNSNGQATANTFSQPTSHSNQQLHHSQSPHSTVPNFVNNQDVVHIILNNLFGPPTFQREHLLRTQTIKSIFTGLLPEKKGERLMTEILERYVAQSEWHHSSRAKGVFEKVLLDILHRGETALVGFSDDELNAHFFPQSQYHHHHQSLGKMASIPTMKLEFSDSGGTPGRPVFGSKNIDQHGSCEPRALLTGRQAVVEEFFIEACLDILDVLEDFSPPCLFELSRMIAEDLDESAKPYASLIIVVKFFFYRFMNKCIAYPETYGMFQDIFITERQRQRILFTTHQRLYRYVTSILNPVPGWESRAPILDPRIRERVESFIETFSLIQDDRHSSVKSSLLPVAESSTPLPPKLHVPRATDPGTKSPTVTPFLLLCPSDFTTLFYFVCPNLRTQDRTLHGSLTSSSVMMTRSSSFNGKGSAGPRQRTSSETPPTYPAAMKAASQAVINSSTPSPGGAPKATQNVTSTRTHKRASPSFSFFAGASSSMPLKAKPPPPMTVEKAPSAIAATEASASGVPFMALSGIKSGLTTSPQTRPVEVTSVIGSIGPTLSTSPQTGDCRAQSVSAPPAIEDPPVIKHWSDEKLLPALRTAITDIKNFQPGPIKEAPHVLSNSTLSPLREAWALAYVQYSEGLPSGHINMNQENMSSDQAFVEVGLTLAPPCMAMVMENPSYGGSRIVTVTKPMLIDQVMDSAGARNEFESRSVDLEVDESDSESLMSPEDNSLNQTQMLSPEDKELSILRVNSSQMLSSMDDSGTKYIPNSGIPDDNHRTEAPNGGGGSHSNNGRVRTDNQATFMLRKKAADRAWKARIRETVHSEQDLPEEVRTVARSIFKVLREFDLISTGLCEQDTFNDGHRVVRSLLQQGIEQARQFGNHASAIGFHHALRVLETSALFRQLDSSKLIYLLAMPIKHRLEHRTGRARVRTIWESYSHQWHGRVVASIDRKRENLSSLRIKMYYQTCVRTSRAFEKSLGVVGVLSRLNKAVLRKYSSMDECDSRQYSGGFDKSTTSLTDSDRSGKGGPKACDGTTCQGTCLDHPCQAAYGEASGIAIDTASRRHSGNTGAQAHANRMGKIRSSSFSTYIDNMTSRSFGAQSLLESGLSNLKEREQAHFSSNYNPNPGGTFWSHSNGSQSGLLGDADIPSDFVMDAREIEAVQRWIEASDIHNFLPGEDNFLRFCMEIELVVRGIGLGGTGIQGAGIPQTQNGIVTPSLSSSGSDFFVKEVAKFNSQFVPGMGPSEPVATQTKTASASGVAEFLVNSFKNSHAGTSAPTTSGSHFFSNATHGNGASNFGNQSGQGSSYGLQSSQTSIHSISSNTSGSKSRLQQRQAQHKPRPNHVDTIPNLLDDPQSIYASQPGPTYVLYNPPYATASHGASSSYFGSPPSGMSSTVSPHHTSLQAKDMTEFLRRIQLKLTSFVLSEWLDIFGEVEADHWLQEFLEELSDHTASGKGVRKGCDEDMLSKEDMNQDDFLPVNEMDLGDKTVLPDLKLHSLCPSSHSEGSIPNVSANSSLGSIGVGDRTDSMTSWSSRSTHTSDMDQIQPKDGSSSMESHPVGSVPSARSFLSSNKSVHSFPSMTSLASVLEIRETQPPVSTGTIKATDRQGLLNIQVSSINVKVPTPKIDPNATAPYNLHEAYRSTIEQFNQTKSPYQKLGYLFALELLIVASLSYPDSCANPAHPGPSSLSSRTKVSEAKGLAMGEQPMSPRAITPGTDAIVDEIENLFRMSGRVRPKNLLRDMQLIATFIPGSILDLRDDGKAFWDMALAVTSLKKDVITYVVQKGTQYVEMDDASTDSRQDTAKSGSRAIMQDDEERMRMSEAVRLFTIGAKESHPVAQRELAILYMSLPMLPASSSPMIGYSREDSSPLMPNSRVPSPVSFTYGKYGRSGARTTPPPSPKGTFSSTMLGTSFKPGGSGNTSGMTASIPTSIPIKQKRSRHHQHSSSGGSGSSFGSGVLSGLGIMTGLGSFTGSSSTGSTTAHDQQQPYATSTHTSNGSTVSLHLQQCGEFAEGHDIEPYLDMHAAKTSASIASYQSGGGSSSLHPYHHYNRRQQQHQQQHQQQQHQQHQASRPDKFNPESVAAAMHWFSLAAAQGDKFSINYLKHKETAGGMMG